MPSILAEISFLTNEHEAEMLKSDAYRARIAAALLEGVLGYQRSLTLETTASGKRTGCRAEAPAFNLAGRWSTSAAAIRRSAAGRERSRRPASRAQRASSGRCC